MTSAGSEVAPSANGAPPVSRADRTRLILLMEGQATHYFRLWDELVPICRSRGIVLLPGTVLDPGEHARQWDELGMPSFSLRCGRALDYPRGALRLAMISRAFDADVVQGNGPIAGFVTGLAGRLGGSGLTVFHRQGDAFPGNRPLTQLTRWAGRLNRLTLACSHSTARHAEQVDGVPGSRIRVAHNAANRLRRVGSDELWALRSTHGISEDAAVISVVSRLRPEKGLLTLFDALADIHRRIDRPLALVIAGDGPQATELRNAVPTLDGVAIRFVGHQDDVAPWFTLGDVVAMPSHREPFGVAAAEAMMCNRPIVAGRAGGLVEVIEDGVSGRLVAPGDADALAAAIAELLLDREQAVRLARSGHDRVARNFTNEAMVDAWQRAWAEFVQ